MQKSLFLICPTDSIEWIINRHFESVNYFYTSLGNAFLSDANSLTKIKELIEVHHIQKIYFVLSSKNEIILDAMEGQFFTNIRGLQKLYDQIDEHIRHSKSSWIAEDRKHSVFSYFLNQKIKNLRSDLEGLHSEKLDIKGFVYESEAQNFRPIYSDLTCVQKHYLN